MKAHLLSVQRWLMDQVPPEFMVESELATMNIALASAHSRLLVAQGAVKSLPVWGRPPLAVVR